MAFYHRNGDRKRVPNDFRRQEEEVVGSLCRLGSRPISPKSMLEQEKRIRREIANSNERRRMQSINAGFQSLRTLLPHREGEKLSKAAILQNTADYIYSLEQEKARLLEQNSQLKRRVLNSQNNHDSDGSCSDSPLPKRKKREPVEFNDEGIGSSIPNSESGIDDVKRELVELKLSLERERGLRIHLEDQIRQLETQMLAEGIREAIHKVHLQYSATEDLVKPSTSVINMVLESEVRSPQSHSSSQGTESPHEIPLRESTPELLIEVPEDLSGKNNVSLPCVSELSITDTNSIPRLDLPLSPLNEAPNSFAIELDNVSQQTYKSSTSRQNLETIVEAIRHVEGDHMFRDDISPTSSHLVPWSEETAPIPEDQFSDQSQKPNSLQAHGDFSFQHQIIRNAPISQSRPGVIVSNHS